MKKSFLALMAIIAVIVTLHSFRAYQTSSITGKVVPPEGVEDIRAVSATDSLLTTAERGLFLFNVKPGTYKIFINAKDPYRDATLDSVVVKEGQNTDVGEVRLVQ